jgi:galactokinase
MPDVRPDLQIFEDPVEAARLAFARVSSAEPQGVAFAPGRVNLIGEHTDYNDGVVLPMAIREGLAAAFAPRPDGVLRVHAANLGETREISLDQLRGRPVPVGGWLRYAAGTAWAMLSAGIPIPGANIAIAASLPPGAGLSSSAAFELAIARALTAAAGLRWDPVAAALLAQRAEQEFAGVACGVMDQMVVACAAERHALLLDCRSFVARQVTLPDAVRVVVMNTGVRRSLTTSAYNDRRAACERAVAAVRRIDSSVTALRDVGAGLLERARGGMDPVDFRRAAHVVAEIPRPERLAAAFAAGDLVAAGRLMNDSHESLRDDYEVSCPELDLLVALARAEPGCHGARLTGAGFGGCAIALVDADSVDAFSRVVPHRYGAALGRPPAGVIVGRPSAGARLVS